MNTTGTTGAPHFWQRAARALGKVWAEMLSLPDRPRDATRRNDPYPRFPAF
jgi:hypothetical protein